MSQSTLGALRSGRKQERVLPYSLLREPAPRSHASGCWNQERRHFCCLKLPGVQSKKVRQNPRPILSLPLASSLPSPALVTSTPATLVPLLLLRHASAQPPLQCCSFCLECPSPRIPFLSFSLFIFSARLSRSPTPASKRRWSVPVSNLLLYSIFLYEFIVVQNTQDRESHLLPLSPVSMWALRGWHFYVLSLL